MTARLSSMTGFARLEGACGERRWVWELKSVNARGLEMRFRMPSGHDSHEPAFRQAAKDRLKRGALNVNLNLQSEQSESRYQLNETALEDIAAMLASVRERIDCAPPTADGILSLRGIMEAVETASSDELPAEYSQALRSSFSAAIDAFFGGAAD